MSEPVTATLAGISLTLETGGAEFLRTDSLWRLRAVHERFLTTQTLPAQGCAIDIGAGFGAFALPFARRYPGWQIWCFEPNPAAFSALERNIRAHGLTNVRAFQLAVMGGTEFQDVPEVVRALLADDAAALVSACPMRPYRRHLLLDGFLDAGGRPDAETEVLELPTLPAAALAALAPDLVKLVAPRAERGILEALQGAMPSWLIGESWQMLSPRLLGEATQAWVPFARSPRLALRRSDKGQTRRDGLDIVLHAADAPADRIASAVSGLTGADNTDIRLILVTTPQTVLPSLPDDTRLRVVQAPHRGWSTAQNLGRSLSQASHIAFLDVLDRAEPGLFLKLLDLARLCEAEVVQGGGKGGPSWAALPKDGEFRLSGLGGGFMPASRLMAEFPPGRARVYRQDFLDARRIWLPEHLRAFSGHYLHFLALQHAGTVPMLPTTNFHESRSFGRLDESAFYLLEVCRLILKRGIEEGWRDFTPLLDGFCLALREACPRLAPPLQGGFLQGMAELLVFMEKSLGAFMPRPALEAMPEIPKLTEAVQRLHQHLKDAGDGYAWAWLDGPQLQAPFMVQQRLWRDQPTKD